MAKASWVLEAPVRQIQIKMTIKKACKNVPINEALQEIKAQNREVHVGRAGGLTGTGGGEADLF